MRINKDKVSNSRNFLFDRSNNQFQEQQQGKQFKFTKAEKKYSNGKQNYYPQNIEIGKNQYRKEKNGNLNNDKSEQLREKINLNQYEPQSNQQKLLRKQKRYAYIKSSKQQQEKKKQQFFSKNQQRARFMSQLQILNTEHLNGNSNNYLSKEQHIQSLIENLCQQRQKFQEFQQNTLQNQMKILDTINDLQEKLKELKLENNALKKDNLQLRNENQILKNSGKRQNNKDLQQFKHALTKNYSFNQESFLIDKLKQQLQHKSIECESIRKQLKKVKGVGKGIVDMMKKVDNIQSPNDQDQIKYAWKWVKKVVWEYEAIRKKAFHWKKAYDELYNDSQQDNQQKSP